MENFLEGSVGIEPTTSCLKGNCSTTELRAQTSTKRKYYSEFSFTSQRGNKLCYNIFMNSKLLWRILILFVAAFLIFSLGKNLYQNWKINQEVEKLKVEISDLRKANDTFTEKLLYYQSQSYREKIARERFGLQKPGEEVVVIVPEARPKIVEEKPVDKTPNYQKWWNYFFGVDK